jgi:hypothetical protein
VTRAAAGGRPRRETRRGGGSCPAARLSASSHSRARAHAHACDRVASRVTSCERRAWEQPSLELGGEEEARTAEQGRRGEIAGDVSDTGDWAVGGAGRSAKPPAQPHVVALPPDAEWWALAIALAAREVWARAPPPPLSLFFPRGVPPDVAAASKRMAHRALVRPRARTPERPHARAPARPSAAPGAQSPLTALTRRTPRAESVCPLRGAPRAPGGAARQGGRQAGGRRVTRPRSLWRELEPSLNQSEFHKPNIFRLA